MSSAVLPKQDFFAPGNFQQVRRKVTARAKTANFTITQPAGTYFFGLVVRNKTANAVTGGIRVGTTAAGVDVHASIAVGASAVNTGTPLIPAYSATARLIYVEAVTAWNSASIDFAAEFRELA